jgi:preprotein translocase subunit SecF
MLAVLPSFVLTLDALLGFTGSKQNSLLSKLYRHIKKTILAIANHGAESSETQTRPNLRPDSSASAHKTDSVPGAARYALIAAALLTVGSIASIPLVGFEEDFNDIGHLEPFWGDNDEVLSSRQIYLKNIRRFGRRRAKYINDRAAEVRQQMSPETFKRKRQQEDLGSKYTTAVSNQVHSMPTILLFDSKENARRVYRHMDKLQSRGKLDTFRAVDSIYAFMPGSETEQRRRKAEMTKIKELLKQQDLSVLSQKVRNKIETFRPKLDAEPFSVYQLPVWTKRLFREAGPEPKPASEGESFAFEYVIMVNPSIDMQEGDEARRFLQQIRRVKRETGIDFPVASQAFIYVSMIDHIKRDGPLMIGLTFLLVFGLLTYVFRDPARAAFALIPLTFGLLWMLGVCAWVGLRLNFFNVIIIPAVIGIGVDDGVHFYFRYLKYGQNSIRRSLETVGFAIIMTSLTSSIGFGGLAIADYAGLKSIGYLAIAGILSTLAATLLLVPSLLYVAEANGWQRLLPGESERSD